MKDIPEIGKEYNCFDDGKISPSRLYTVNIKEIIPFREIDEETLNLWKDQTNNCNWLFAKITDVFVKTENSDKENETFVRTIDGGWFSIGGFLEGGRLDITGELTKMLTD